MPISIAILLGLIQGLTEFLPVSSSGHLVVFQLLSEGLLGAPKIPLSFDVFLHLATLLVTLIFLRADIVRVLRYGLTAGERGSWGKSLALLVVIGSLPAAVVGLCFKEEIEAYFSSLSVVANGLLVTTAFLVAAHFRQRAAAHKDQTVEFTESDGWTLPSVLQAFIIGMAQALAILPGISRSGSTIAVALLLGVSADSAVRYSFFLSIPAILGATILEANNLLLLTQSVLVSYLAGFLVTCISGWFAMKWLIVFTRRSYLLYFAAYTLLLSLFLRF